MKKAKISCLMAVILSVFVFNSCSNIFNKEVKDQQEAKKTVINRKYGAYLAGRVAHLRKDFNLAADYYVEAIRNHPNNADLVSRLYVILASEGRVPEAAVFAKEAIANGDSNNFTYIIIAVDEMKKENHVDAVKTIKVLKGPVYDEFINPLLISWAYVGEGNKQQALVELNKISKEPMLKTLYNFHAGMINDYFDDVDEAKKHYDVIIKEASMEMSFRSLQVISNFYIRNGGQQEAIALVERYNDDKFMIDLLKRLLSNVEKAKPENTKKIIRNANDGLSEALFSIAATLRQGPSGVDLAHIFICLSIYANEDYDLSKLLLADILESREMYHKANEVYDKIPKTSEAYYTAQLKKANNFSMNKEYEKASMVLRKLLVDNPKEYQVLLDLADNLRMLKKYDEAIKYYSLAIDAIDDIGDKNWVVFYARGVAYERTDNWEKAEVDLKKALELSQNHYLILNYLGYCWMQKGENTEQAFSMIVDAYNQVPNDGHIIDSMGWALYNLGMYDKAVEFLEKASEAEPANALINDHLGDAYWRNGRKTEAVFQWQHALVLKDDIEEIDLDALKVKIDDGLLPVVLPRFDDKIIIEKLDLIKK